MKLSIRQLTLNAMIAAIYVVITIFLPSYGPIQLRMTEMFAHLPMFNRKYSIGLIIGVAIANIRSEFGIYDVLFGTLHTAISLAIVFLMVKKSDSMIKKMMINSTVFTVMSFILALMVAYLSELMPIFWTLYGSFAASIALVMFATIPVMLFLNKQIKFDETMER